MNKTIKINSDLKDIVLCDMEVWKPIKDYEQLYEISNLGNVKSLKRSSKNGRNSKERILCPLKSKEGYLTIVLFKDKSKKRIYIHRLVAMAFIPNLNNLPQVNHINGDKTDNRACNLEWVTNSENQTHAIRNGLKKIRQVNQYDIKGNFIQQFCSVKCASESLDIPSSYIRSCLCNSRKSAGGYIWRYSENDNKYLKVNSDLKDMIIGSLRYALGRKTYITGQTADFIINNPSLIDERVKKVMIKDLEEYFAYRDCYYNDDECDYQSWLRLYEFLGELK